MVSAGCKKCNMCLTLYASNSLLFYKPNACISVDEAMIPFKGEMYIIICNIHVHVDA